MTFLNEASKLLTNKYFLYFISFLAATNVLGYLVTNNLNAVTFFLLVSLITYQFSKNMTVILLIAVILQSCKIAPKETYGIIEKIDGKSFEVSFKCMCTKDCNAYSYDWFYSNKPDTLKMYHKVSLR